MTDKTIYDQLLEDEEFARLMAQEDLIMEVTESFCEILKRDGIKRIELAELLKKTKGYVSQILNGGRNITLRTVSDIAHSIGYRVEFKFHKHRQDPRNLPSWKWKENESSLWRSKMLPKKLTIKSKAKIAKSYGSMLRAICKASGAAAGFTPASLKDMSAMELIKILGLNNISFTFDNPEFNTEEKEYTL